MSNLNAAAPPKSFMKRWRPWVPASFILATAGIFVWAKWFSDMEAGWRVVSVIIAIGVSSVAVLLWFAIRVPIPRLYKAGVFALLGLAAAIFFALFHIDFKGRLIPIPRYRFAWAAPLEVVDAPVDLTDTKGYYYPRFLGASITPEFPDMALATDWKSSPPQLVWRQPIGEGFSSFAVVGDYAVTQQQSTDKQHELVVCYHWPTGKARWKHADKLYFDSFLGGRGPRATPAIDEGRVYALGSFGLLNCLDGGTGKLLWSRNVVEENEATLPQYGKTNSPLIVDDLVVVSAGGPNGKSLIAYDKVSGDEVWSAGSAASSYSSPQLATIAGVRQIISFNQGNITGHDPRQGDILWTIDWPGDMPNVAQPRVLSGDRLLVTKEYSTGSALFLIENTDRGWSTRELWADRKLMKTKFTNPVFHDGYVYGLSDVLLQCIDPFDGKQKWIMRGDFGNGHVLLVGDLLLVQTEQGGLELYPAQPTKPQRLASFQALEGRTWNYPVLMGEYLLMRNDQEMALYRLPLENTADGPTQAAKIAR